MTEYHFGLWFWNKALRNAFTAGVFQAARNLRKQGVPIEIALAMLRPALVRR